MWTVKNEQELLAALAGGNVSENRGLDFKRETGSSDGARRETAADLASFAIYGGHLLIGVAEDKATGTFSPAPQILAGAAEKLEDIARNRIDPPLFIRVRDIATAEDPLVGYLVVEVPPSPTAPHMVDGRYYARADRTKRRLTDAEVVQLHAGRRRTEHGLKEQLFEWASREVVKSGVRRNGHLNLIAEPLMQSNGAALRDVARAADPEPARGLIRDAERAMDPDLRQFEPRPNSAPRWRRRADGGALTSLEAGVPTLGETGWEESLVDIELHDNGGFRVLMGRHTNSLQRNGFDTKIVFDIATVSYAWLTVQLAKQIASVSGYRGPWGFALSADRLGGRHRLALLEDMTVFSSSVEPYGAVTYEEVATAQLQEIEDAPGQIVERLVGRFLDGLGSHMSFAKHLG